MNNYTCPHCSAYLNVNGFIVMTVKDPRGNCGICLLSDQLGDYTVHSNEHFKLEQGLTYQFYCPGCKGKLDYHKEENRVRIFMTTEEGEEHTIIFSAVLGENATYQVSEDRAQSYGEKAAKFMDPEWYLKGD